MREWSMMDNDKVVKKIVTVLAGIFLSVAGAMLWSNGGYKEGGLLQLGEIYDLPKEGLLAEMQGCVYDEKQDIFLVQNETAELYLNVNSEVTSWNYCTLKLKNLNHALVSWRIDFLGQQGEPLFGKDFSLNAGTNNLKVSIREKVGSIKISMNNQVGYSFRIKEIKLLQRYFDIEDFIKKTFVLFLACVVFYILIARGKNSDWYVMIEILQNFYICLGNALGKRTASIRGRKLRQNLQILCFMVIFLLMIVMDAVYGANYSEAGRYWVFGFGALLVIAGLLSFQKPLKKVNWRSPICFSWLLLWGMACFSDLFVRKSFSYTGYMMILCGGFAFFIWHNERNVRQVFYRAAKGLEWTLVPVLIYCVIFRQKKMGILYNGCFRQHESLAMYALTLIIFFLSEWNLLLSQEKLRQRKFIACGLGMAAAASFLYYTRVYWCMAAVAVVLAIWLFFQIRKAKQWKGQWKLRMRLGVVTAICAAVFAVGVRYAVQKVPVMLGTDISYTDEVLTTNFSEGMMYAMELEQPGWISSVVKEPDRHTAWHTYVQKINLLGNFDRIRVNRSYLEPPNGIVQIAYRYGILILAPYLLLLLLCVYQARKARDFLWSAVVVAFLIGVLWGRLESPFAQPLWLMFYLGVGQFLNEKRINM